MTSSSKTRARSLRPGGPLTPINGRQEATGQGWQPKKQKNRAGPAVRVGAIQVFRNPFAVRALLLSRGLTHGPGRFLRTGSVGPIRRERKAERSHPTRVVVMLTFRIYLRNQPE